MILRSGGWLVAVARWRSEAWGRCGRRRRPPRRRAPPAAPQEEKLTEQKEGDKQKTLWDEFKLFSFVEMGATFNLNGGSKGVPGSTSDGWTNTLRLLRHQSGLHVQHGGVQHQARSRRGVPVRAWDWC